MTQFHSAHLMILLVCSAACKTADRQNEEHSAALPPNVAATVNESIITKVDVARRAKRLAASRKLGDDAAADAAEQVALERLIEDVLIEQEASRLALVVTDQEVSEHAAAPDIHGKQMLESDLHGSAPAETLEDARRVLLRKKYIEQVWSSLPELSRSELQAHYAKIRERFRRKEAALVGRILMRVPPDADANQEQFQRARALSVRRAVMEDGADFEEAAQEFSDGAEARTRRGRLGWVPRGRMHAESERLIFSTLPGSVSEVARTALGWEFVKVFARTEAGFAPVEEVEDLVRADLEETRRQESMSAALQKLRSAAKVKKNFH